jgi:hypothetical protein
MREYPEIDVVKAAGEVKAYLDRKKFDLVDWTYTAMECYPDPHDPDTPELAKFAAMWEEFFDYADGLQIDNDGKGFPNEIAKRYEDLQKTVEDAVNADGDYWSRIRDEVLPLYVQPKSEKLASWRERWKSISLFYDPIGLEVTTTRVLNTGLDRKRELVRKTNLPPGFVIKVN